MAFYEGSQLMIEWTNQHSCGGSEKDDPNKANCNIVIQYACDTDNAVITDPALQLDMRDGTTTNTPTEPNDINGPFAATSQGEHESEMWYLECKRRSRNKGLFLADQKPNGESSRFTRQNPNGNRRGLECPEERDYYPYWAPTPWRDIAYLTDRVDLCPMVLANTQNTNQMFKCTGLLNQTGKAIPITQTACTSAGGQWVRGFAHNIAAPYCGDLDGKLWSRDNHLGNSRNGQMVSFNWTLPFFSDGMPGVNKTNGLAQCVLRLRYNISTDDYDPWTTNATFNDNPGAGLRSPVTNNPTVPVGSGQIQGLRLAINTAQFGRTFQDRSHIFYIAKRPSTIARSKKIYNLNVRGKRGNIVQTYPAVEYDFVPNRLHVTTNDLVHIQWTGSNTHNNGHPAGDGQAGDAGEGRGGTDRNNILLLRDLDDNYPLPYDKYPNNLLAKSNCYDFSGATIGGQGVPDAWIDCALLLATSGQFRNRTELANGNWDDNMNNAPASLIGGVVLKPNQAGTYHYMCSRNNNFSNRSQKGSLIVA